MCVFLQTTNKYIELTNLEFNCFALHAALLTCGLYLSQELYNNRQVQVNNTYLADRFPDLSNIHCVYKVL